MDPKYGEAYRELFEKHWWWRVRTELIVDKVRQLKPAQERQRILDIGCGDALFFDRLTEFGEVEGVEPCEELVNPNNPYRDRIYVCPFDERFRPGKQYSLILMLDVLEHLDQPVAALQHALGLIAQGGAIIITVPAFMALWTNHDMLNHHRTRYTKRTFNQVARLADLKVQEERYLYQWTCPVKFGVGIVERFLHPKPAPPTVPGRWTNDALYWLSRIEEKTVGRLSVPFGSSLMVVGGRFE